MGDVVAYGGDPKIVASRAEIERVQRELSAVSAWLDAQIEPLDFLLNPIKRVGLAMELPVVQARLETVRLALSQAADSYFSGEARVANEFANNNLFTAPILAGGILAVAVGVGGAFGLLSEGSVSAFETGKPVAVFPPRNIESLVNRLMQTAASPEAQVRIERFGSSVFVYIPGTKTWNPIAGKNPLDATSNLWAMQGPGIAASERAVSKAMGLAGVGAGDNVMFVGHSQGGLVAANLASAAGAQGTAGSNPKYRVAGLVTLGAPIAHLAGKLRVPTLSLEHTNDVVPKLSLKANPITENWVTAVRETPTDPNDKTADLVEAHDLEAYRETAKQADESTNEGLSQFRKKLSGFAAEQAGAAGAGATVGEARWFELRRD